MAIWPSPHGVMLLPLRLIPSQMVSVGLSHATLPGYAPQESISALPTVGSVMGASCLIPLSSETALCHLLIHQQYLASKRTRKQPLPQAINLIGGMHITSRF